MTSFNWNNAIPTGLAPSYSTPQELINALNALDVNLIPQMFDFTMSLTQKYNLGGSLRISWNCPGRNAVFSGKRNLRTLSNELNKLDHKAKVMLLVATNYQQQRSKALNRPRICCFQFVFQNKPLVDQFWND